MERVFVHSRHFPRQVPPAGLQATRNYHVVAKKDIKQMEAWSIEVFLRKWID